MHGYRSIVGEYEVLQDITVAFSKATANTQFGNGGAWQFFVEDYSSSLKLLQEINLK